MSTTQKPNIPDFLKHAIESEIQKEVEAQVEEARKRIERRVPEIVAGITLDIMAMTSFQDMKDRIIFEIRKK